MTAADVAWLRLAIALGEQREAALRRRLATESVAFHTAHRAAQFFGGARRARAVVAP
ncbi:hypothetical protein [Actinotalea sp. JY-7876]|uniref:hypothetical protein n=1 Tax=Actinotalea sp. JY-7876 TaxID=2758442 RepID=UPI0015F490E5|nr:hypothetical protein [Actinotalea sp. JY-7876]